MARSVWSVVLLAATSIISTFAWGDTVASGDPPTVVVLVRHAEKAAAGPDNDPRLTADGRRRAEALAAALKDVKLSAIITTQLHRTVETAQPSADMAGVNPEKIMIDQNDPSKIPQNVAAVTAAVRNHPGGTVLVVGHNNTVPAVIAALGAPQLPIICDWEYDRLFMLVLGKDVRLVQSRYGTPSPPAEACN